MLQSDVGAIQVYLCDVCRHNTGLADQTSVCWFVERYSASSETEFITIRVIHIHDSKIVVYDCVNADDFKKFCYTSFELLMYNYNYKSVIHEIINLDYLQILFVIYPGYSNTLVSVSIIFINLENYNTSHCRQDKQASTSSLLLLHKKNTR